MITIKGQFFSIAILLIIFFCEDGICSEELSGTYSAPDTELTFLPKGSVDVTTVSKIITEQGPSGIKYGKGHPTTLRGTYSVVDQAKFTEKLRQDNTGTLRAYAEKYTPDKGYTRWILVSFPDGSQALFVESGRTLVNASNGHVLRKAWYSR